MICTQHRLCINELHANSSTCTCKESNKEPKYDKGRNVSIIKSRRAIRPLETSYRSFGCVISPTFLSLQNGICRNALHADKGTGWVSPRKIHIAGECSELLEHGISLIVLVCVNFTASQRCVTLRPYVCESCLVRMGSFWSRCLTGDDFVWPALHRQRAMRSSSRFSNKKVRHRIDQM